MTPADMEAQAERLLADVRRLAADPAPAPDLLHEIRLAADGIRTATYRIGAPRLKYRPKGSPGDHLRREAASTQRQAERTMRAQLAHALEAAR